MCVAAGIVGAAVVGGVASNMAANKAAGAQKSAAKDANATQLAMYNQQREDQAPWRNAGASALSELAYQMGLDDQGGIGAGTSQNYDNFNWKQYLTDNPDVADPNNWNGHGDTPQDNAWAHYQMYGQYEGRQFPYMTDPSTVKHSGQFGDLTKKFSLADFEKDPGYQFRLDEGLKGVQSSAAARGGLLNGGTLKALTKYGQDFASNEYGNAYNRFNNDQSTRFNRLSTIAGIGQTANNTLAGAGQNYANSVSQNQLAVGNANAASAIATGNAVNNGINNVTSYYTMKNLFGNNGGGVADDGASGNYYQNYSNYA